MTPRQQARLDGHIYYVTGKPCKNGHVGLRYTSTGGCVECLRDAQSSAVPRQRTMTPRQQAKERGELYYLSDKPCKHGHVGWRYTSTGNCLECLSVTPQSVARQQAKERGDRIYYGGQPCPHGHTAGRYTSNGACVQCTLDAAHRRAQQRTQIRRDAARLAGHTFYRATRRCEHDHAVFHHVETDQCAECHAPAMTHDQLADYNLIRHKAKPRPDNQHLICSWDDWRYWFAIYLLK